MTGAAVDEIALSTEGHGRMSRCRSRSSIDAMAYAQAAVRVVLFRRESVLTTRSGVSAEEW